MAHVCINRTAAIIRPKQPFLDWLNTLPNPLKDLTLESIRQEAIVFLMPVYDTNEEVLEIVYSDWDLHFEEQLEGWWKRENEWPQNRSLEMFKAWFDVEICSEVVNMTEGPIEDDEVEPEENRNGYET